MEYKKNDLFELSVESMNNLGNGVAKADGVTVFVTGAVEGDRVRARVIKVTAGFLVAKAEEILVPSPYRVEDNCRSRGCGGCAYRGLSYERERAMKEKDVLFAFRKAGLPDVGVLPLLSTGVCDGYRNKAQYPVAAGKDGTPVAGFFASRSHRVIPAADCPLESPLFRPIVETLLDFFRERNVLPYDETTGSGSVRHLYLRTNRAGNEQILTIVLNGDRLRGESELRRLLQTKFPTLVGVLINTNTENTNVICGEKYRLLYGRGYIQDELCGVKLEIAPQAFYQVNHDAAELLYRRAADLADLRGDETVLDLYCGIGSIGLSVAHRVRRLVGIEVVPESIECAKRNAAASGIENAVFFCGDAGNTEEILEKLKADGGELLPDVVFLDPPRKGCAPELLDFLAHRLCPPKIVYISCNPDTLARDAAILSDCYHIGDVTPVDLFPRTGHVEAVVLLTRKE